MGRSGADWQRWSVNVTSPQSYDLPRRPVTCWPEGAGARTAIDRASGGLFFTSEQDPARSPGADPSHFSPGNSSIPDAPISEGRTHNEITHHQQTPRRSHVAVDIFGSTPDESAWNTRICVFISEFWFWVKLQTNLHNFGGRSPGRETLDRLGWQDGD